MGQVKSAQQQVKSLQKANSEKHAKLLASVTAAAKSAQEQVESLQKANSVQHAQFALVTAASLSAQQQVESLELANSGASPGKKRKGQMSEAMMRAISQRVRVRQDQHQRGPGGGAPQT